MSPEPVGCYFVIKIAGTFGQLSAFEMNTIC